MEVATVLWNCKLSDISNFWRGSANPRAWCGDETKFIHIAAKLERVRGRKKNENIGGKAEHLLHECPTYRVLVGTPPLYDGQKYWKIYGLSCPLRGSRPHRWCVVKSKVAGFWKLLLLAKVRSNGTVLSSSGLPKLYNWELAWIRTIRKNRYVFRDFK